MPKYELNFLSSRTLATDQELLLQLVYGLCGQLNNPREEACEAFVSAVNIPNPQMRRLAKLLVKKLDLPIPIERVDEWIDWQRNNQTWIVPEEMKTEAKRLKSLDGEHHNRETLMKTCLVAIRKSITRHYKEGGWLPSGYQTLDDYISDLAKMGFDD